MTWIVAALACNDEDQLPGTVVCMRAKETT
jgi:hypothetical protein